MKNSTSKKISKSTKYYLIYGILSVILIVGLLLLYAHLTGFDIAACFTSKYAYITYGALAIYLTIGISLIVRDIIRRM